MAFNGSGVFTLAAGNPVVTGTTISSTWANNTLSDIATGLSTTITKDGQSTPTANIPMGGFKLTGLGAATTNGDALRYENLSSLVTSANLQVQTFTAFTTAGTTTAYTLTPTPAIASLVPNQRFRVKFNAANTSTTPTLAISGLAATAVKVYDPAGAKQNPAIGALALNMLADIEYDGTDYVVLGRTDLSILTGVTSLNGAPVNYVPVRQTVLSGPVTTSGLPSFGGATGSTTVTASGTLIVSAANGWVAGGPVNRPGSITNPSWTGVSTNGVAYAYLDVNADGTCTPGVSANLAPTYRWGGADVTTNGQFTFNIQEMVGKVGNGATAAQTYRVYVGEFTVAGNVVTAITWYALMRRYISPAQAIPADGTPVTLAHNIGVDTPYTGLLTFYLVNVTGNLNYVTGDMIPYSAIDNTSVAQTPYLSRLSTGINGVYTSIGIANKGSGVRGGITPASWRLVAVVNPVF